jgi:hypothetical protein
LNFLKIFERTFKEVQNFIEEKDAKKSQMRSNNGWRD